MAIAEDGCCYWAAVYQELVVVILDSTLREIGVLGASIGV